MKTFVATLINSIIFTVLFPCGMLLAAPVRFIPLNDEIAASMFAVKDSKGITNLKPLAAQKRSTSYTFKTGEKPLQLMIVARKDAEGKPATVEIPMPAKIKSPLVLILPDLQHPSGLRVITIDDSTVGFPWGSLRFFNLTDGPLMLRFGEQKKPLPDGNAPVDILPGGDAHNVGVQLFKEDAPTEILYSAVWEHDPNFRKLIVISTGADKENKSFAIQILPEDKRAK